MRYWIVSELFYPEEVSTGYVMTKIAEKLSLTEDVNVICGPSNYQAGVLKATYNIPESINIKRVSIPQFNKNRLISRLLSSIFLTAAIGAQIIRNIRKTDKIILVTNPPTLVLFVSFLKRFIGFKLVIIVHDVFPENLAAADVVNKKSYLYKLLLFFFNRSYNKAQKLIVVGQDMKELFAYKVRSNMPIAVVTNWADHEEVFPNSEIDFSKYYAKDISGKVVIGFAGNIGRVQGLDRLFEMLKELNTNNFEIVIIGDGAFKSKLSKMKDKYKIMCVSFFSSKPRSEQVNFLNACDIGLVSLCPGMFGLGVPSKVYNIMAAGKPLFYIGDENSEISRYIKTYDIGWSFTWDEKDKILEFLQKLNKSMIREIVDKGQRARQLIEQKLNKTFILERYKEEIIDDSNN